MRQSYQAITKVCDTHAKRLKRSTLESSSMELSFRCEFDECKAQATQMLVLMLFVGKGDSAKWLETK